MGAHPGQLGLPAPGQVAGAGPDQGQQDHQQGPGEEQHGERPGVEQGDHQQHQGGDERGEEAGREELGDVLVEALHALRQDVHQVAAARPPGVAGAQGDQVAGQAPAQVSLDPAGGALPQHLARPQQGRPCPGESDQHGEGRGDVAQRLLPHEDTADHGAEEHQNASHRAAASQASPAAHHHRRNARRFSCQKRSRTAVLSRRAQ